MLYMKQIDSGTHFFYRNDEYIDDLEFIVLYKMGGPNGGFHCITAKSIKEDQYLSTSDFYTSNIYDWLHREFLQRIGGATNASIRRVIDGDCGYQLVSLLTERDYDKYKDVLFSKGERAMNSVWLKDRSVDTVLFVNPRFGKCETTGYIECDRFGIRPVVCFNFESGDIWEEQGNIIFSNDGCKSND